MSLKVAVPLSAATTRYGSGASWMRTPSGCTTSPSTRLSVMSSNPRMNVTYCVETSARSSSGVAVARFRMKPPLEPSGTITAFFTFWAFIRPRTSVR